MSEWYDDLPKVDAEKVQKYLSEAKTEADIIQILYNWHPKGVVNLKPVQNLEEFFKYIRIATNSSTWFRGESREHEAFIPKLYRNVPSDQIDNQLRRERQYIYEFKRRAKAIISNISNDDYWTWYFLAQHYGAPTRLFDWTTDASVALFMALDTSRERTENPIIYMLSPMVLTSYAFKEIGHTSDDSAHVIYPGEDKSERWIANITENNIAIPESPISLLPAHSDPRIISQKSCFTLFGKRVDGFTKDGKEIECDCCGSKIKHRIVIDGTRKNELRQELLKIGVSSGSVYPGLDGLAKELNNELFNQ